jgi:hypothetical protein
VEHFIASEVTLSSQDQGGALFAITISLIQRLDAQQPRARRDSIDSKRRASV